jgi:hypothetical protein
MESRVSSFILMKSMSGTAPSIGIFSLLLVRDAYSCSTHLPFGSDVKPIEDKKMGKIFLWQCDELETDSVWCHEVMESDWTEVVRCMH